MLGQFVINLPAMFHKQRDFVSSVLCARSLLDTVTNKRQRCLKWKHEFTQKFRKRISSAIKVPHGRREISFPDIALHRLIGTYPASVCLSGWSSLAVGWLCKLWSEISTWLESFSISSQSTQSSSGCNSALKRPKYSSVFLSPSPMEKFFQVPGFPPFFFPPHFFRSLSKSSSEHPSLDLFLVLKSLS